MCRMLVIRSIASRYIVTYVLQWIWSKRVWNRFSIPKHIFILWLIMKQRLLTRSRLVQWGVANSNMCCLCDSEEEAHTVIY